MIQGGDISDSNGAGGESIYGGYYDDEQSEVSMSRYMNMLQFRFIPLSSSDPFETTSAGGATQQTLSCGKCQ